VNPLELVDPDVLASSEAVSAISPEILEGVLVETAQERYPPPMKSLASLVARSREGDMTSFRDLYEQTRPGLFNVVVRLADCEDDAQEIVQQAFVKAWQQIHELREDAAFAGWLRRIAMNLLRDHWRRTNRFEEVPDDDEADALSDPSPDASEILIDSERLAHLETAIQELPEMFRFPVVLHYLDSRSVEEVAGILELPRGTVLSRLSRARARLKTHLLRRKDPS